MMPTLHAVPIPGMCMNFDVKRFFIVLPVDLSLADHVL